MRQIVIGKEAVDSEIELPLRDEVRVRDVLLQDHCLILAHVLIIYRMNNLPDIIEYLNTVASVCVLPWL